MYILKIPHSSYVDPSPKEGHHVVVLMDGTIRQWEAEDTDTLASGDILGFATLRGTKRAIVETSLYVDRGGAEDAIRKRDQEIQQLDSTLQHYVDQIAELQKQIAKEDEEIVPIRTEIGRPPIGETCTLYRATMGPDGKVDGAHDSTFLQRSLERQPANREAADRVDRLLAPVRVAMNARRRVWWKPWTWRRR